MQTCKVRLGRSSLVIVAMARCAKLALMTQVALMSSVSFAQTDLIRVAQVRVAGNDKGLAAFDAHVVGVIKPWSTTKSAVDFYQYGVPIAASFNGVVPLTAERIHLFFAQASDGLCAYGVYDKPGNADGGRVQMEKWVRPRAAVVESLPAIDREGGWCFWTGHVTGSDNRWWHYQSQHWDTCCTDGWAVRLDRTAWTSFRVALNQSVGNCSEGDLYRGINSMAAISGDGSVVPLALNQDAVQFRPVAPCELVAWPSQQSRCVGGTATFSVRPNTTGTPKFVWRKAGVAISVVPPRITVTTSPDGLESTLTIKNLVPGDAAKYTCDVTSACGASTSPQMTLTTNVGSPMVTGPTPTHPCAGSATLKVTPSGSGPFTFQWLQDGVPMHDVTDHFDGTDTATLQITNAVVEDTGAYRCVVSNGCGSVTSQLSQLTVCPSDFNCDGFANADDFDGFVLAFVSGTASADFNRDGFVTADDYDAFVVEFLAGC